MNLNTLTSKSKTLPSSSGCYLMRDKSSKIIYIGKAKNLKKRVSSYFTKNHNESVKTKYLVEQIIDFDFVITETEVEAFILENNLIKKHSPKYNFRLKDDKTYPYVQIDLTEPSPKLEYTRKPKKNWKNKLLVFGPFTIGSNVSEVIKVLTKSFGLRDCTLRDFKTREKACLLYQMQECSAPCVSFISDSDYNINLKLVIDYLKGRDKKAISFLNSKMKNLSDDENFEKAAILRDDIKVLKRFIADKNLQKNVEGISNIKLYQDVDVINYHYNKEYQNLDLSIYIVRNGLLIGHKNIYIMMSSFDEISSSFQKVILDYYQNNSLTLPKILILPNDKNIFKNNTEITTLEEMYHKVLSEKIKIQCSVKDFNGLLSLAKEQSVEVQKVRISGQQNVIDGLKRLGELIKLKNVPMNLECYDIAIWQGQAPTASRIVFNNGKLQKSKYRNYHLKTLEEGNNDFAMMKEVFERRIKKDDYPDVFIVDGGKAQVNTVLKVLKENNIDVPVVGIAKAKNKNNAEKTQERLVIPGRANDYVLKKNMNLFKIVVSMRDEAHRFSRKLHHKKMQDQLLGSWIYQVKGLSRQTKNKILRTTNESLKELVKKSRFEIEHMFRLNKRETTLLLKYFKNYQE
jgi:excinuclease ABC subunit C